MPPLSNANYNYMGYIRIIIGMGSHVLCPTLLQSDLALRSNNRVWT